MQNRYPWSCLRVVELVILLLSVFVYLLVSSLLFGFVLGMIRYAEAQEGVFVSSSKVSSEDYRQSLTMERHFSPAVFS